MRMSRSILNKIGLKHRKWIDVLIEMIVMDKMVELIGIVVMKPSIIEY